MANLEAPHRQFSTWFAEMITTKNLAQLTAGHPDMDTCHPTNEHFLPFVVGLAMAEEDDEVARIDEPDVVQSYAM
jgi:aromatic ring-opening dioxygenase catalytic subunit (LigB family)